MDCDREELRQNLKDAGCGPKVIERFLEELDAGAVGEQLALLSQQRRALLDKVHREERKIDCLDYLVYQIRQNDLEK